MAQADGAYWPKAWIIGASSGIGHALARRMASQCGLIAVSARSSGPLDALADAHDNIEACPLDITDRLAVDQMAAHLDNDNQPLDLVVISSGLWHPADPLSIDPDKFAEAMNVNFSGVINVLAAVVPDMASRGRGHIAIVASVSGYRGLPKAAAYSPAKAALINLVESIRPELNRKGIAVTIINPGFVDTPMTAVNSFPMPFMVTAENAADRIAKGLSGKQYEIAFPRRFVFFMKLARLVPNRIFFWFINKFVLK